MRDRIEKWKQMEVTNDPGASDYLKEITAQAQAEDKLQVMDEVLRWLKCSAETRLEKVEKSLVAYRRKSSSL